MTKSKASERNEQKEADMKSPWRRQRKTSGKVACKAWDVRDDTLTLMNDCGGNQKTDGRATSSAEAARRHGRSPSFSRGGNGSRLFTVAGSNDVASHSFPSDGNSCGAKSFPSFDPAALQGRSQKEQFRRAAMDAPGWVQNTKFNEHRPALRQLQSTTQMAASKILKTHRPSSALEWPPESGSIASRSLASTLQASTLQASTSQSSKSLNFKSRASRVSFSDKKKFCRAACPNPLHTPRETSSWQKRPLKSIGDEYGRSFPDGGAFGTITSRPSSIICKRDDIPLPGHMIIPSMGLIPNDQGCGTSTFEDAQVSESVASADTLPKERSLTTATSKSSPSVHKQGDVSSADLIPVKKGVRSRCTKTAQMERQKSISESSLDGSNILEELSEFSASCSNSVPPSGFTLPCKEVRDAIKYHYRLGKALSKLALSAEMTGEKGGVAFTMDSMDSTAKSTLDSSRVALDYATGTIWRLGASNSSSFTAIDSLEDMPSKHFNQIGFDERLERVSSMDSVSSSCNSSRSNQSKLEQHLSFLEGHMIRKFGSSNVQYISPTNSEQGLSKTESLKCNNAISFPMSGSFFPIDDLKSPPLGNSSFCESCDEAATFSPTVTTKNALTPLGISSPPSTPIAPLDMSDGTYSVDCITNTQEEDWNDDDTMEQEDLDSVLNDGELVDNNVTCAKDGTSLMMLRIKEEIRSDLQDTVERQMEQHHMRLKLTVSQMTERLENAVRGKFDKENEHPQFSTSKIISSSSVPIGQKQSKYFLSTQNGTDSPTFSERELPRNPSPKNSVEEAMIRDMLETSLRSMEESIMIKICTQMDKDALRQRNTIEEIIEDKVCKAIAGSSLEMKLAVQEMKKDSERLSKMALREIRTPPRTPPRQKTSPSAGAERKTSVASPIRRLSSPKGVTGGKSSKPKISQIRGGGSGSSVHPKGVPYNREPYKREKQTLEDSFAETMRVIDEFVDDCDDLAEDFDRIAFRMQDCDIPSDPDCDPEDFQYTECSDSSMSDSLQTEAVRIQQRH